MKLALAATIALLAAVPAIAERRCGWLDNPTPANWWLTDRDGEWTIMTQGGRYPDGMEENMGDMAARGWVRTNGYYGYGCACMDVETDRREMRVTRVISARPVPLSQCRNDRSLPRRR
jgi:Protein of unknown function (DUF4087)